MDREKESIFFQLVRSRYEKKSIIITTNLELREWDEVFTSQLAATAILDRLVHHSHIVRMGVEDNDDSYRIKGRRGGEVMSGKRIAAGSIDFKVFVDIFNIQGKKAAEKHVADTYGVRYDTIVKRLRWDSEYIFD